MTPHIQLLIETPRLKLSLLDERHIPAFVAYRRSPEVARFQSWLPSYSEADARRLVEGQRCKAFGSPGWMQIAIEERGSGVCVGDVALRIFDPPLRQGELGFTLDPAFQGRGLALEAAQAVIDRAFSALGLDAIVAITDALNRPAAALLERLGMVRDGPVERVLFKGAWSEELRYRLPREAWSKKTEGDASA